MHFKWNYEPPTPQEKQASDELSGKLGIHPILAQLLIRRGITTESAAKRFFRPQLADLINPFLMKDMDVAVDRLNDAMGRKERILDVLPWLWCISFCNSSIQTLIITSPIAMMRAMG